MQETLDTSISIDAPLQTVWAVLDDISHYSEWNSLVPQLSGLTLVGRQVEGVLTREGMPTVPLKPTITQIVPARELRWRSERPTPGEFRAEHYFILQSNEAGGTTLIHNEDFAGTFLEKVWADINTLGRAAYDKMNRELKVRAEAYAAALPAIHPAVDAGSKKADAPAQLTLSCRCAADPIQVSVSAQYRHNHLCGCSKCWKPEGALFALIAIVPAGSVTTVASTEKLQAVDEQQKIIRYACRTCGAHMVGRVTDKDHHFFGLEFIHPELSDDADPASPEFAGFVSSLIESGAEPAIMAAVRARLNAFGIPAYDSFSPEIMDVIAWHRVKLMSA